MLSQHLKLTKTSLRSLIILAFSHAQIDFISVFLLFQVGKQYNLGVNEFLNLAILYNLIAFATQFLVGLIVDKYKIPKHTVILGIILATISLFLFFISISDLNSLRDSSIFGFILMILDTISAVCFALFISLQ